MCSKASSRALHQLPVTEVSLEDTLGAALLPSKLKVGGKSSRENTRAALRIYMFTKQVWLF